MKYSDLVGVEPFFDSTFNITEEKAGYWKSFITNDKFENNLSAVLNAFNSETINNRKSIWVQGTYGTGKSHSTSVMKHILSDDVDEIEEFVNRLKNPQLRSQIFGYRAKNKVFPVVLKGTNEIVDVEEMKYVIQKAVSNQIAAAGIELTVKSDFEAVLKMVEDKRFASFWEEELKGELKRYAIDIDGLKKLLVDGDVNLLKEINLSLKKSNMMKATENIVRWLTEVARELRNKGIAQQLVIVWDEFTSLLDIAERRSILNTIQDIAELSKAPDPEDQNNLIGVYVFLVTHKNMEAMDSYKELKEDEKTMAKSRFLELQYDMQDRTTYHILSNAIKVKDESLDEKLISERIDSNISIAETLDRMTENFDKPAETKKLIKKLYPFHPYTAYLATFVSRAIGSAERSIFEFLNDEEKGFKKFLAEDINDTKFLTADYVWDFFVEAFQEDGANDFSSILSKYRLYSDKLKEKGNDYLVVFKIILLLNLLSKVITTDNEYQEKSLIIPSETNIISTLSGKINNDQVLKILGTIDDSQIILRNPEGIYEIATSALPMEKILHEKKQLYTTYEDPTAIFDDYPVTLKSIEKEFKKIIYRSMVVEPLWAGAPVSSTIETKLLKKFKNDFNLQIALFFSRGNTKECDAYLNRSEKTFIQQQTIIEDISRKDDYSNICFILFDTPLGKNGFEGFIDSRAREKVALSLNMATEAQSYKDKAEKWINQWRDNILSSGKCTLIFRGNSISSTVASVNKNVKNKIVPVIFSRGLEKNPILAEAKTAWPDQISAKVVENICFAKTRTDFESKMVAASAPIKNILKDLNDNYIFDENLHYTGNYNLDNPFEALLKSIDDKFSEIQTKSIVDLSSELVFITVPEYGYYSNQLCMAAVALCMHKYIDRIYRADKGTLIDAMAMKDIIVALFNYWQKNKNDSCYKVRFSTEEEKQLVELIHDFFKVSGDGIVNTKWNLRKKFEQDFKSPLWVLKYVGNNNDELNNIIDSLFMMTIQPNDNIKQEEITKLLKGLNLNITELKLSLGKIKDSNCMFEYYKHVLRKVNRNDINCNQLQEYLTQEMQDNIVFWGEADIERKILEYCAYQGTNQGKDPIDDGNELVVEVPEDDDFIGDDDFDENDDTDSFEPIILTPLDTTGKTHTTIEETTAKINSKNISINRAKEILGLLCSEYPVICDKLSKLLDEE